MNTSHCATCEKEMALTGFGRCVVCGALLASDVKPSRAFQFGPVAPILVRVGFIMVMIGAVLTLSRVQVGTVTPGPGGSLRYDKTARLWQGLKAVLILGGVVVCGIGTAASRER